MPCVAGDTQCGPTGGLQTCLASGTACTTWSPESPCANPQVCDAAASPAACACPELGFEAGTGCPAAGDLQCDLLGESVLGCATVNTCTVWTEKSNCTLQGLGCGAQTGNTACECPPNPDLDLYVDAVRGSDAVDLGVLPSGVAEPPQCRFGTLTYALSQALPGGRVLATGAPGTGMVFTHAAGATNSEDFPLVVPASVALTTTDAPLNPVNYTIIMDQTVQAGDGAVTLLDSAEVSGFTITVGTGAATPPQPLLVCTEGAVLVDTVELKGTLGAGQPTAQTGFDASGSCSPTVLGLNAHNLNGSGLRFTSTDTATLSNSQFTSTSRGIHARNGTVDITASVSITGSTNQGVLLDPPANQSVDFRAAGLTVSRSGGAGVDILNLGGTVSAALDSATLDNNGRGTTLASGISVQGSGSTLSLTSTSATNNGRSGLQVAAGTVSVTGGRFTTNGPTTGTAGSYAGVELNGGTTTLSGATVDANTQTGVLVTGGTLDLEDCTASGNSSAGVGVSSGDVTLTKLTASSNRGRGVYVNVAGNISAIPTTVRLTSPTLQSNGLQGLHVVAQQASSATVTVHGTALIASNGPASGTATPLSGATLAGGTVTLGGSAGDDLRFQENGAFGVHLNGSTATLNGVIATGNGVGGILVSPEAPTAMSITGGELASHARGPGLMVSRAQASASIPVALTVTGVAVHDNGLNGVRIAPVLAGYTVAQGAVTALLNGLSVHHNADTGMLVQNPQNGLTTVSMVNNNVYANGTPASSGFTAGGLALVNQFNLATFFGNRVHDNAGDQVSVLAGAFTLENATRACDATANQFYCYGTGGVGLRVGSSGGGPGATNAAHTSWHHGGISGVDFAAMGANAINTAPVCGFSTAPACGQP